MILITIFCLICILQTIRIFISYRYLTNHIVETNFKQTKDIFIIVPVLQEQNLIEDSVTTLSKLITYKTHLVYVTSAKEKRQKNTPTTLDLLNELKHKYPIEIIHCPLTKNAVMAHQINYAIKKLKQKIKQEFIIGIYNVDSQITQSTIQDVCKFFNQVDSDHSDLQQYTLYPSQSGGILSHIALWQNRWTLHFELGRILIGNNPYFSHFCQTFNYVIGHGLFFTSTLWRVIDEIPQDISNEDACLGLILYTQNLRIYPIKHIEYALIAKNINVYIKQQSVWFNGPLYSFLYAGKICKKFHLNLKLRFKCYIGALKLFTHAVYWLFGPISIWLIIPMYLYPNIPFMVVWWLLAVYHCYCLNLITMYCVNKIKAQTIQNVGNLFDAIVAYLFHCVGPIYTLIKIIRGKNSMKFKYKTEK